MWIRNDVYNISMGYRKYSLADMFEKGWEDQNPIERIFVGILENVPVIRNGKVGRLGTRAALRIAQAEDMWQEAVKVVKDIWVIKNLFTLLGNEMSNFTVLMLAGVPVQDIVKNKILAFNSTMAYQGDRRERDNLQRQLGINYLNAREERDARQRIIELDDAMDRNPVKELIDAGMFQTLVEDIAAEEDQYSYKSRLTSKIDQYTGADSTNRAVKAARGVAKGALLTHDTAFYKVMNQATILSDFTSRYTMHQHLTKRSHNPLSKDASLQRARAAFVNYDVPTHKGIQYLNDTGLLWFTKYYLRIQAVLFQMVKENPVGALGVTGLDNLMGGISDILDSSMLSKWPGNLGWGAAELPGAVDEIITFNTLGKLL
jgi:hypothetical protein